MKPTGVHLLLTYQCNFECDHCFVHAGPGQTGTMRLSQIREVLRQCRDMGSVEWIYFEGGEPFLYYAILREGVRIASRLGFRVGLVSNAYWATDRNDAIEWLRPFRRSVGDLAISSDAYHGEDSERRAGTARAAAEALNIPVSTISIAPGDGPDTASSFGQLAPGESAVMYRGRAADRLSARAPQRSWSRFTTCPYEDLRAPRRVHLDPFGHVHVCQGISIGNVFRASLKTICDTYDPDAHPVTGPLLEGGPVELVRRHGLAHAEHYADACHMCYEARRSLRPRLPACLAPEQMYQDASDGRQPVERSLW